MFLPGISLLALTALVAFVFIKWRKKQKTSDDLTQKEDKIASKTKKKDNNFNPPETRSESKPSWKKGKEVNENKNESVESPKVTKSPSSPKPKLEKSVEKTPTYTITNIPKVEQTLPSSTSSTKVSSPKVSSKSNEAKTNIPSIVRKPRVERDEVKEAEEFEKELRETERKAVEEAKSFMRPIQLNIDKSARSKEESDRSKEKEMILIKKLCGEVREIAKASNPEEREERRQEMEKVRSARLRCQ